MLDVVFKTFHTDGFDVEFKIRSTTLETFFVETIIPHPELSEYDANGVLVNPEWYKPVPYSKWITMAFDPNLESHPNICAPYVDPLMSNLFER